MAFINPALGPSSGRWCSRVSRWPASIRHDHDQRAILVQGDRGSAQVIRLRHGALHRWLTATMVPSLAARPRASVPAENSLFGSKISLFGSKNSLLCCLGNLAEKAREPSRLDHMNRRFAGYICENSLFFPCLTGNSEETGSQQTPCTASSCL